MVKIASSKHAATLRRINNRVIPFVAQKLQLPLFSFASPERTAVVGRKH